MTRSTAASAVGVLVNNAGYAEYGPLEEVGLERSIVDERVRASYAATARGASVQDVARVVVKAVTAARPATRYKVTAAARVLPAARVPLPDRAWDRLLRRQFPTHG